MRARCTSTLSPRAATARAGEQVGRGSGRNAARRDCCGWRERRLRPPPTVQSVRFCARDRPPAVQRSPRRASQGDTHRCAAASSSSTMLLLLTLTVSLFLFMREHRALMLTLKLLFIPEPMMKFEFEISHSLSAMTLRICRECFRRDSRPPNFNIYDIYRVFLDALKML